MSNNDAQHSKGKLKYFPQQDAAQKQYNTLIDILAEHKVLLDRIVTQNAVAKNIMGIFPINTEGKLKEFDAILATHADPYIRQIKVLLGGNAERNLHQIFGHDIIMNFNVDGTFGKKRLRDYGNVFKSLKGISIAKQQNILIPQKTTHLQKPAAKWSLATKAREDENFAAGGSADSISFSAIGDTKGSRISSLQVANYDSFNKINNKKNNKIYNYNNKKPQQTQSVNSQKCANLSKNKKKHNCLESSKKSSLNFYSTLLSPLSITPITTTSATTSPSFAQHRHESLQEKPNNNNYNNKPSQLPSTSEEQASIMKNPAKQTRKQLQQQQLQHEHAKALKALKQQQEHKKIHIAHRQLHKEVRQHHNAKSADIQANTNAKTALEPDIVRATYTLAAQKALRLASRARRDLKTETRSFNEVEETVFSNEEEQNQKALKNAEDKSLVKQKDEDKTSNDASSASISRQQSSSIALTTLEDDDEQDERDISIKDNSSFFNHEQPNSLKITSSSSSSSSSSQSNSADAINFGSQEISGSLEDLLASQMPQELELFPNTFHNESSNQNHYNYSTVEDIKSDQEAADLVAAKHARSANTEKSKQSLIIGAHEPIIIIDDTEEFDSGTDRVADDKSEDYVHDEPRVLPLRPLLPSPYDDLHAEEMSVVYSEQHTEIRLMCEVDLDIATSIWYKNGMVVHAMDRTSRVTDYRFIKEANGGLTITDVMLEDDGKWQCEAENTRAYVENARPVKLVVLDRPKPPYLLIDSRRLDAGNIFVPVKENSELNLACISEGGNPKPTLTWEVLLSPGVDRHAQKVSAEMLELEEIKSDKDKEPYKINSGAKSEARLPVVYRAHHNARILCVMEHPTLKIRQNASLLLDVQYTPSFAISRTPGFGYPLREGIEVSLKCDVDSNPPSTPRWQKDEGDTPVPQTGDGFLNFSSVRREHSGWYKCTSRHLNFQYSSIGYFLSVRYDSVDVTSEPDDQDISVAAASHNPNKGQLEVQLGGAVTLQCPQGSLGCWSHLDPVTARLRGLGHGLSTPTGQFSLKDVVYQDAGTYKCIGQSPTNKKKLEVLQTVGVAVKGPPTVTARNATPVAYPGSPLHLSVEFCANPPAHAARWLHGDRVFTPGNQYGSTVLAYGVTDLPTPYCKEARLTYVSMHERVPRTFYFIVSSPGGVAEATFKVNFTMRYRTLSNAIDDEEEELSEPEEIHFPVFGSGVSNGRPSFLPPVSSSLLMLLLLRWVCNTTML